MSKFVLVTFVPNDIGYIHAQMFNALGKSGGTEHIGTNVPG